MSPNVGSNNQTHRRLDTPRPMTTGMKMIARVVRRSGVFGATSKASRYPPTIRIGVMNRVYLRV